LARNENASLDARHVFVAAKTGGGKSQMLRRLVKPYKRLVAWDPDNDLKAAGKAYSNKTDFIKAFIKVMDHGGSVRWAGEDDIEHFEWFMSAVWTALDGNKLLAVVVEEAADVGLKAQLVGYHRKVWVRGRKYGAVCFVATQRVQNVPKAFMTQAAVTYLGQHMAADEEYLLKALRIKKQIFSVLKPLEFYQTIDSERVKVKIPYVK